MLKPISAEKIDLEQLAKFTKDAKISLFKENTMLIYKGQIPTAAIFIKSGSVLLKIRKKAKKIHQEGILLLFHEVLDKKNIGFDVEASSGSEIIWIDRISLRELVYTAKQPSKFVS